MKKGTFLLFTDTVVYATFIIVFAGFLLISSSTSQGREQSLNSNFVSQDADTVLITLMRTAVNEDLNNDGDVDAESMADLIALSDDYDLLKRELEESMMPVCTFDGEEACLWSIKIKSERIYFGKIGGGRASGQIKEATIYVPRYNGEVAEVVLRYGE